VDPSNCHFWPWQQQQQQQQQQHLFLLTPHRLHDEMDSREPVKHVTFKVSSLASAAVDAAGGFYYGDDLTIGPSTSIKEPEPTTTPFSTRKTPRWWKHRAAGPKKADPRPNSTLSVPKRILGKSK
jgi:hypothetical protein